MESKARFVENPEFENYVAEVRSEIQLNSTEISNIRNERIYVASSSDEEFGSSGSGSSNCSSGDDEKTATNQRKTGSDSHEILCEDSTISNSNLKNAPPSIQAQKAKERRNAEKKNRKNARYYLRAVRVLAKMSLLLENPNILTSGHANDSVCRKLGKLMIRYDSFLQRLENEVSECPELEHLTAPSGLLQALDANVDPYEWIEKCVVEPHQRENEQSKGVLTAIQNYEATIHHMLKWGCVESSLPSHGSFTSEG